MKTKSSANLGATPENQSENSMDISRNQTKLWDSKSANTQIGGVHLKNKNDGGSEMTPDQIDSSTTLSTQQKLSLKLGLGLK